MHCLPAGWLSEVCRPKKIKCLTLINLKPQKILNIRTKTGHLNFCKLQIPTCVFVSLICLQKWVHLYRSLFRVLLHSHLEKIVSACKSSQSCSILCGWKSIITMRYLLFLQHTCALKQSKCVFTVPFSLASKFILILDVDVLYKGKWNTHW